MPLALGTQLGRDAAWVTLLLDPCQLTR